MLLKTGKPGTVIDDFTEKAATQEGQSLSKKEVKTERIMSEKGVKSQGEKVFDPAKPWEFEGEHPFCFSGLEEWQRLDELIYSRCEARFSQIQTMRLVITAFLLARVGVPEIGSRAFMLDVGDTGTGKSHLFTIYEDTMLKNVLKSDEKANLEVYRKWSTDEDGKPIPKQKLKGLPKRIMGVVTSTTPEGLQEIRKSNPAVLWRFDEFGLSLEDKDPRRRDIILQSYGRDRVQLHFRNRPEFCVSRVKYTTT